MARRRTGAWAFGPRLGRRPSIIDVFKRNYRRNAQATAEAIDALFPFGR